MKNEDALELTQKINGYLMALLDYAESTGQTGTVGEFVESADLLVNRAQALIAKKIFDDLTRKKSEEENE